MFKILLLTFISISFFSCSDDPLAPVAPVYNVKVYALAPVLLARVEDASGKLAFQSNLSKNIYTFSSKPKLPIKALSNGSSAYVDVDYDGKKTANDVVFDEVLYTNSLDVASEITTLLLASSELNSSNMEFNQTHYDQNIAKLKNYFNLNNSDILEKTPYDASSKNASILSDTIFLELRLNDFNASDYDGLKNRFNFIETFFTSHLLGLDVNSSAKYHANLEALEMIDASFLKRIEPNSMPFIHSFLNSTYTNDITNINDSSKLSNLYNDDNLAYWGMSLDKTNNLAYIASGKDGLDVVDIASASAKIANAKDTNDSSFSNEVIYTDKKVSRCIFVADQERGINIFGTPLNSLTTVDSLTLRGAYRDDINASISYDMEYIRTNTDINSSSSFNLERLVVAQGVLGLRVIDVKDIECNTSVSFNADDSVFKQSIGIDVRSVAVSSNGKVVYITDGVKGIKSIDISGSSAIELNSTALNGSEIAYDVHSTPHSNSLYVSSSKGVQLFQSDDNSKMLFQSYYHTEGARANDLGENLKVQLSSNSKALFIADISGGLKVLDISNSKEPQLCGVAYFRGANIQQPSSVRDIKLVENGLTKELFIANDSVGLIKLDDARSVLFNHCKNLLD